jgi:hypothetical protein
MGGSSIICTGTSRAGGRDIQLASAPALAAALYARLEAIEPIAAAWQTLLRLEERAYRLPGLRDCGEFLLAKARVG